MQRQASTVLAHATVLGVAAWNINARTADVTEPPGRMRLAAASWAGQFSQVLRVNPNETAVRNICELTLPLSGVKPLTFIADGSTVVGWNGSAASAPGLEVGACGNP